MAEQVCANCGMPRFRWKGNDGRGYLFGGREYCCAGCAEREECTCGDAPRARARPRDKAD